MPVYKKKSKRFLSGARRTKKSVSHRQSQSHSTSRQKNTYADAVEKNELKVVKGRKLEQQRKLKISAAFLSLIVAAIIVFELALPVGINDSLENFFATLGSGSFPIEVSGTDLIDAKTSGGYFYGLSNTSLNAYNSSGKELFSYVHGFENPVIKKSSTRLIIFEQGGNNAAVFNLSEQKSKIKTEDNIVTANISRCGVYAIVTNSQNYASTVSVYNKNDKLIYEWYSAEDIVNNIVIAPNGKKIAVSTINAKGGEFDSKVQILEFDSANSVFTADFKTQVILSLDSSHNRGFWCISENTVKFIKWSKYEQKEFSSDYNVSLFKADLGGTVAVYNRLSDKTDCNIVLFNKNGEKKNEFKFSGNISDISVVSGHIYCISDNTVFLLDTSGNILKTSDCSFGGEKLFVIGTYDIAVINDNMIEKIHFE